MPKRGMGMILNVSKYLQVHHAFVPSSHLPLSQNALYHRPFLQSKTRPRLYRAGRFTAKLKVQVLNIGKRSGKDAVFDCQIDEFVKRMRPVMTVETNWLKPATAVASIKSLCSESAVILLDEHGKMPRDSEHFSDIIYNALEQGGSRLAIVIGDAEGLPSELLSYAEELRRTSTAVQVLSLSPLTFTHKMVRLFVYEQLYRATEIRANSKYHK